MSRSKLLIATSNTGKYKEIKKFLSDLPFDLLSLNKLKGEITAPPETELTLEGNAVLKAKFYAEKTGLLTISEDTGLFVKALKGWPGVKSARIGQDSAERNALVLKKISNKKNREAVFCTAFSVFNPIDKSVYISIGETAGKILYQPVLDQKNGFGYDPIFFVNEKGKAFAEMNVNEKNACSSRGKALFKVKNYLQSTYSPKHIVVPIGIVVNKSRILITKRNDPHRPDYHEKWEFPGGSMEWGEEIENNVKREVYEETGCKVEPLKQLQKIYVKNQKYPTFSYQVYLIPYVCRLVKGQKKFNDAEVLDMAWITPGEISKYHFVGENLNLIQQLLPELKQVIKEYNL